jgi:hypothetical protein
VNTARPYSPFPFSTLTLSPCGRGQGEGFFASLSQTKDRSVQPLTPTLSHKGRGGRTRSEPNSLSPSGSEPLTHTGSPPNTSVGERDSLVLTSPIEGEVAHSAGEEFLSGRYSQIQDRSALPLTPTLSRNRERELPTYSPQPTA